MLALENLNFIFMQFSAKSMPNKRVSSPLGLAPLLGNPGSMTDF